MSEQEASAPEVVRAKKKKSYPRRQAPLPEVKRVHTVRHHALFRPPQGQDWQPEKFERIYVSRVRTDGELEEVPKWFSYEELDDLGKLRDMFGGGVYELKAIRYDGTIYRIVRTNRLPGPPKPLYHLPDEEEEIQEEALPLPAAPQSASGEMLGMFQLIISEGRAANERMMLMMQQNNQMMMQSQQHSTEVLVAALSGGKQDMPAMISALSGAMRQNNPPAPPPVDAIAQARQVMDLAKGLTPPKEESIGEIVGAVAQGIGAMGMMSQMAGQQAPQQAPSSGAPALPPSGPVAG
jgi:hypothetical protein